MELKSMQQGAANMVIAAFDPAISGMIIICHIKDVQFVPLT
jgi:hypothetical protein